MGMLVLERKPQQRIRLEIAGTVVWVEVLNIGRRRVRLGFVAPPEVSVKREELLDT